ncbi:protein MAINTENANCE OF MERISTEMS-like [Hibiscus syriacus]|uniref:protein MAINTENANCE OF MERISTEMS-like n=1 Tax=Hibiscus syriacus TaxID=106335 RepID=UPI0019216F4C|nr:protein MAINTENANCE OF MERISTEMS-like [Hibiscus syriacus]
MPTLISALIEHWRPETHTFHLPCGEVTITLEDVVYQLGVPINGMPLVLCNTYKVNVLILNLLGNKAPSDVIDRLQVQMTWLESEFRVDEQSTEQEVIYAARAYLMTLIGGILLPDKSGNLVHTQYLSVMEDFAVCRQYSWGFAILPFLYRELCKTNVVVRGKKADVAACLVLLQSWAWYRLPFMMPITSALIEFHLTARWRHRIIDTKLSGATKVDIRMRIDIAGRHAGHVPAAAASRRPHLPPPNTSSRLADAAVPRLKPHCFSEGQLPLHTTGSMSFRRKKLDLGLGETEDRFRLFFQTPATVNSGRRQESEPEHGGRPVALSLR